MYQHAHYFNFEPLLFLKCQKKRNFLEVGAVFGVGCSAAGGNCNLKQNVVNII